MNFFGGAEALEALSRRGDPLQRLEQTVTFESFRSELERALAKPAKGPGGAPRWDAVLMFKLLVLQRLYHLSDDQAEYQASDRLSFRRFLGPGLSDPVPDSRTLWRFRETLVEAGTLVDASFVTVPKQRNTREENDQLKRGETPSNWSPAKRAQKSQQKKPAKGVKKPAKGVTS